MATERAGGPTSLGSDGPHWSVIQVSFGVLGA